MRFRYKSITGLLFSAVLCASTAAPGATAARDELLRQAEAYYELGNYDGSITEYQRFAFFSPDDRRLSYAYRRIGMAYGRLDDWESASSFFRNAVTTAPTPAARDEAEYQSAIAYLALRDFELAKIDLFQLVSTTSNASYKSAGALLLGLSYISEGFWQKGREYFREASLTLDSCVTCRADLREIDGILGNLERRPRVKSPSLAKWLSTFVPGSGQLYAGATLNALNACALNSLTGYFLWDELREDNLRDSALFAALVWFRYYQGNRLKAQALAEGANRSYQELATRRIFDLSLRTSERIRMPEDSLSSR